MPSYPPPSLPLTEIASNHSTSSQYQPPSAPPSAPPPAHNFPPRIHPHPSNFSHSTQNTTPSNSHPEKQPPKPAGRRHRQNETTQTISSSSKEPNLNQMGRLYSKVLTYSTGTRYSIYIVPIALILMIPIIVGATQATSDPSTDPKIGGIRVVWFFTWFETIWLSFWLMKAISRFIPLIFEYFAGVVNSSTKKYARVLENLRDVITVLGWVVISFVMYEVLFSTASNGNTPLGWTTVFKKVLGAILVSTVIFTIEKVMVQFLSVSYHRRSFNERIGRVKREVCLWGVLFEGSRGVFPMFGREFWEEDCAIRNHFEAFVLKGEERRVKENGFKGMGKFGTMVNSVFGNIAAEITGKSVLPARSAQGIVTECLERRSSGKALASRIWFSFVGEGNDVLRFEDVKEVLGEGSEEVARECFEMVDPDGNGDVGLEEMILKVRELGEGRKAIARSMHDVSQAIKALDNVMSAVCFLLGLFTLISFLDTGFNSILTTASSALLSLSFIFSVTAQEFLGSCIFLFIKHPYDIKDRVDISGPDGVNREVEQISLLYTEFKRISDLELVQIPNNILNTLWINNITRSKGLLERLQVYISFDTPLTDIELLRAEMEKFVNHPDHKRDFQSDIVVRCLGVGSMDKLQLQLEVRHKSNWSVESIRASRPSKLMCALVLALRKIPIFGPGGGGAALGDPNNPTYSVVVSDQIASAAREKFSRDAEAVKFKPGVEIEENTNLGKGSGEDRGAEKMAADALNSVRLGEALSGAQESNGRLIVRGLKQSDDCVRADETALSKIESTTKSPQGRRRMGMGASLSVSRSNGMASFSQQPEEGVANTLDRTQTADFDTV